MGEPERTDVVVIGMGPGGEYAAGALAEAGLHVTGVEERLVGGECPYFGCIPTKMMIRAGNLIAETRRVPGMAGTSTVTPDWSPVALRIREEATDYWNDKVAADRFESKGGHLVRGRGTITGPGEVTVASSVLGRFAGVPGSPGHRDQQRHRARDPARPGPGRHPLLDEPGDRPDRAGAGIDDRARRRGHRHRTGPGLLALRHRGHRGRGAAAARVVRGARGQRADRADLHPRGHQGVHRRPGRADRLQGRVLQRAPRHERADRRAAAGGYRAAFRSGRARAWRRSGWIRRRALLLRTAGCGRPRACGRSAT